MIQKRYPQIERSDQGHLRVPAEQLTDVMQVLKQEFGFNYLTNVTAVDHLTHFSVVYDLCIIGKPDMLHVLVNISRENPEIPSMVPLWGGALWQERETYDLLGIQFTGHPDLRRILLNESWQDHPLRKDFVWESGRQ
jgi:NADH-quinone oxidoreductase subunit C